jgi:hypothetical protein
VVALGGGAVGSYASKSALPVVATSTVAVSMYLLYVHAKNTGLQSGAPGTENYSSW